jgi:hypothetical protein
MQQGTSAIKNFARRIAHHRRSRGMESKFSPNQPGSLHLGIFGLKASAHRLDLRIHWPTLKRHPMKRIRAQGEITRRTYVAVEVHDDLDDEEIKRMAVEEAELAEWQDDPPGGVSFEVLEEP